jgi:serine/threonine-protein kinase PknG
MLVAMAAIACKQPGCTGTIEDGYCDACGMAPAGGATAKTGTPQTAAPAASTTGRSQPVSARTGSGRTPSTRSGRSTRSTRSGSTRSGRTGSTARALGGRPLARPPLPPLDPLASLVPAVVPERKRFCSNCDAGLKRDAGFCPKCGQEYSFLASLNPGDMVAGKYEIKGTIAFGGLGWIYLALDTVLNRWVILKGLLNSKDPRMLEVAVQEREFLAAVKHPNIVGIYDFVTHGPPGREEGFIAMECVNGKTLMTLRKEANGPLPVPEAISYIAEILPALGYLDDSGMVYCDFKPENVMVEEETVKLIDLGAVRRVDDTGGDIYGSKGYIAPEAHEAPTPLSDLYSVARALAVLVASFDFQGKYEHSLPPPSECDVFANHEPLYRFLLKATREKPEERFQSAAEMAEQLVGVLHAILGEKSELKFESTIFDPDSDRSIDADGEKPRSSGDGIPRLKVDKEDPAANVILAAAAVSDHDRRRAIFERAYKQFPGSLELGLRIVDELVSLGKHQEAEDRLIALQQQQGQLPWGSWRFAWYRGRSLLGRGQKRETVAAFSAIVDELPGELAPKAALARAHEQAGEHDRAIELYDAVSRADPAFTSAAIGLARCHEVKGDRKAAAEALRRVPPTSNRYARAQMALARLMIKESDALGTPDADCVVQASTALSALDGLMEGLEVHRLRADVLAVAVAIAESPVPFPKEPILGVRFAARPLRAAAERELRTCARIAESREDRIRFVDAANAVRPMTWT